jgi:hypothetical protein
MLVLSTILCTFLERKGNKALLALFKMLPQHLAGIAEEIHEIWLIFDQVPCEWKSSIIAVPMI